MKNKFVTLYYDYYSILPIEYIIKNAAKTVQIVILDKLNLVLNLKKVTETLSPSTNVHCN